MSLANTAVVELAIDGLCYKPFNHKEINGNIIYIFLMGNPQSPSTSQLKKNRFLKKRYSLKLEVIPVTLLLWNK